MSSFKAHSIPHKVMTLTLLMMAFLPLGLALAGNDFRLGSPDGLAIDIFPPAPTAGPGEMDLRRALDPRQAGNSICGWVSGRENEPFTCNPGSACIFNTKYSVFGCCAGDLSTCSMQTSCFGSTYATYYTANGYVRGCTDSVSGHCVTYGLGFYSSIGCGTSQDDISLKSTIIGGTTTAVGLTTGFFAAIVSTSGNVVIGGSGVAVTTLPSATAGGAAGGSGPQATSGSGGSTSSTTNNVNNSANASITGGTLSTGAIVGIAVGAGAIIITLVIIGIFVRRRRNSRTAYIPQHGYGYGQQGYGPPPSYPSSPPAAGGLPPKQPMSMTSSNLDTHLSQQGSEWAFAQGTTPQRQTAGRTDDDGIRMSEIMPEEAVDERRRQDMARPMSDVGQTAVAPTAISHHVQGA